MKSHYLAAALLACTCAAGAQNLKPGLWEVTHKAQSSSGQMEQDMAQMQQEMAAMPPEQRKMVEEMMAKHGIKAGAAGRHEHENLHAQGDGRANELPAQAGRLHDHPPIAQRQHLEDRRGLHQPPSTGEGQVTFISPEAYSMKMVVTSESQGKPEKTNMESTGKWLGSDCGNIKPVFPPPMK